MESVETYCDWGSPNLETLDSDQKRLVLETLDVQAIVDGAIEGLLGHLLPCLRRRTMAEDGVHKWNAP
jgi:hypothetical protein